MNYVGGEYNFNMQEIEGTVVFWNKSFELYDLHLNIEKSW